MARISITKCHGTGNDFVLFDRSSGAALRYPELAARLCDRRFGVGADGLLVLEPARRPGADVAMRIFNADGSEAETCGNGIRCVARYCNERSPGAPRSLAIETIAGIVVTTVVETGDRFAARAAMGVPDSVDVRAREAQLGGRSASVIDVVLGNPHVVAFVDDDLESLDLDAIAREAVATSPFPSGANVEIARAADDCIAMRVHERGVGETWACGTGACAAAIAAIVTERSASPVRVAMRGGTVVVAWSGRGHSAELTGGAAIVFDAAVEIPDELVAAPNAVRA